MPSQKNIAVVDARSSKQTRKFVISLFRGNADPKIREVIEEREVTLKELPEYIEKQTYSLIQFKGRVRQQANFLRAGCIALDIDGGLTMGDAISRLKERKFQSIVAPTRNHQKEKVKGSGKVIPACDRYRILISLSRDVENEPDHRATIDALRRIFPESDPAAKDGARIFFPSLRTTFQQLAGLPFDPVRVPNFVKGSDENLKREPESVGAYNVHNPSISPGIDRKAARKRAMQFLSKREPAVEGSGGDMHTLKTAMRLFDLGIKTADECCALLEESGWNDRCDPPWIHEELFQKCLNAMRSRRDSIGSDAPEAIFADSNAIGTTQPAIILGKGNLHQIVDEAEKALMLAKVDLYVRGPGLVVPIVEDVEAGSGRRAKVTRLKDVNPCLLRLRLSESANWLRWDGRKNRNVRAYPPREVAESILERDGQWKFPNLAGVITCPTLRPDGSVLSTEGYDPITRLLLVSAPSMPVIPERPTKNDAAKALSILESLLTDFPYVNEASKAVALSMLITPVVRGALSCAPLHAVRATTAGTGKSFSTDLPSCIVSGQRCPVIAAGRNEEETEKRLGAVVRTGQPIINVDNVNGELGGDALCQLVERPTVQIRLLGRSESIRIENKATIFATGNGIILTGDMTRRVLLCSLDANVERPELRRFSGNPVDTILANRGLYISSALVIARAYFEAGFPGELQALGSFGDWSRVVRSALVWLGKEDPVKTMDLARSEDPSSVQFGQIISAWKRLYGINSRITAGDLARQVKPRFPVLCEHGRKKAREGALFGCSICDVVHEHELRDRLFAAFKTVASDRSGNTVDPSRLGKWLSTNNGKIVMGVKLIKQYDTHKETNEWTLAPHAGGTSIGNSEKCHSGSSHNAPSKSFSMVGKRGRK